MAGTGMGGTFMQEYASGFIDEDSLLGAYLEQDMRCQHCVATTNSWFENNP